MHIEFRYRSERSRTKTVLRPVAKIVLENQGIKIHLSPYIDSGADLSLLPLSIGEALGFVRNEHPVIELSGIGKSKVAIIEREVLMTIGTERFSCHIGWALIEEVPLLLGRRDVFERFEIIFREWEGRVLFRPKSEDGISH